MMRVNLQKVPPASFPSSLLIVRVASRERQQSGPGGHWFWIPKLVRRVTDLQPTGDSTPDLMRLWPCVCQTSECTKTLKQRRKQQKDNFHSFILCGLSLDDHTTIARLLLVASTVKWRLHRHKASQLDEQVFVIKKETQVFEAAVVRGSDEALQVINLSLTLIAVSCCLALIS